MSNIFGLFYQKGVNLMHRLGAYRERSSRYLRAFREYIKDSKIVLDVGCGNGTFSKALDDGNRLIVALDILMEPLRKIEGLDIKRLCADAHHIPLRGNSSLSLMEHLEDPEKPVRELYRILKPNGTVVLQLPNLQYIFEPHNKWPLLCLFPKSFQYKVFKKLNYGHVNMELTVNYTLRLFKRIGFELRRRAKLYYLSLMKALPVAPSYIFILEKVC